MDYYKIYIFKKYHLQANKMIRISFLFLLLLFVAQKSEVKAQSIVVATSSNGIVLHYNGPLNFKEIKLFRNSKEIAILSVNKQESIIRSRLKEAEKLFYTHPVTVDSLIGHLAKTVESANQTDKIFNIFLLPVKMACGLAYVDKDGKTESVYTAQIDGKNSDVIWDSKAGKFKEPALNPKGQRSFYRKIETSWTVDPANPILYTKLFRKNHDSLYYNLIDNAVFNTAFKGDTIVVMALDTTLKKLSYYHYQIAGFDFYGNPTKLSKMMVADNLDNSTLPVVKYFTATENEAKTQVNLKWKIAFKDRVKSALLFRSFKSDKEFKLITQLPPADSVYVDEIVYPMEAVFYKLVLYDLKGLVTHAPVVPLVSKQKPDALPPSELSAQLLNGKPVLKWKIKDQSARGFYVFRTEAIGIEPIQVSAFVDADTSLAYQWTDTSKFLQEGKMYHYAIVSDSKGYVKSDYSEFVSLEIPFTRPPRTPVDVVARKLDYEKVLVAWNLTVSDDVVPLVYSVYRSTNDKGPFERVNRLPIFAENSYIDTLPSKEAVFYYTVSAQNENGKESAQSVPFRLLFNIVPWGIRNIRLFEIAEGVEITWPAGDKEVDKVEIQRMDESENIETLCTLSSDTTKFIDSKTLRNKTYSYRIVSLSPKGEKSEPSEWVTLQKN